MASNKRATNPLLAPAISGFSLSESFGPQAPLLVPSASTGNIGPPQSSSALLVPSSGPSASSPLGDNFVPPNAHFNQTGISPVGPPPALKPPPEGLFLLPQPTTTSSSFSGTSNLGPPPVTGSASFSGVSLVSGQAAKRSPYVPPPGIRSSASTAFLPSTGPTAPGMHNSTSFPNFQDTPPVSTGLNDSFYPNQTEASSMTIPSSIQPATIQASNYNPQPIRQQPKLDEIAYHWFYKMESPTRSHPLMMSAPSAGQEVWKPFTMIDSVAIEEIYSINPNTDELIPTDGGRYDVSIKDRMKTAVYWKEDGYDHMEIRRCSWFYKSNFDGRWIPFDEDLSSRLEKEFVDAVETGLWNRRLEMGNGEHITMHSEKIIVHFPSSKSSMSGSIDDWGQVQPPTDPALKPREVHRGLDGLPEIPDGESPDIDHLVFVVHGIGSACDIKLRPIVEVVDGFRELAEDMSQKHFQSAHLSGRANRIEFLPVNWHRTLHGEDTGTDERLKPLTLRSIPKLRSFVNETLLDILFYSSPIYCQKIIDTVVSEINRMYSLFMARNENFKGEISVIGHSLGSLIVFDILSHQLGDGLQQDVQETEQENTVMPSESQPANDGNQQMSLEQVFALLDISEHAEIFTNEGIDMDALMMCNEDDLKEGGLPLGPRKKLLKYLEDRKNAEENNTLTGLEKFQKQSIESDVKYIFGPAGTGQPSVTYPRLMMNFSAFYAFGSPLAMFLAVRGIESLGPNFSFPTCSKFFNIFHPYDPIAYRVEGLINPDYGLTLRPVTIPHHKGRKRMHLELKDTVTKIMSTDIKQKVFDTISSTINAFYSITVGNTYEAANKSVEQVVEQEMEQKAQESDRLDSQNPKNIDSRLNQGKRIDYALQEAPLESFNEYLFALASHLCYWESEDTVLMILRDIYSTLNIVSDDQLTHAGQAPIPYLNAPPGKTPYVTPHTGSAPPPPSSGTYFAPPPVASFNPDEVQDLQATNPMSSVPTLPSSTAPPIPTFTPPPIIPSGTALPPSRTRPVYQAYFGQQTMGMDPTAPPAANDKPIAPPPMSGFVRK